MEKSFKKITLKKEAISNLNNSQMNELWGGNISNRTLPGRPGCDSIDANCCTYNQCGNIRPTFELCNTYNTCLQNSMYGITCTECVTQRCTADGGDQCI